MSYIGNQPSGQGQAERFIFTATGTTPTITHDDDGLPISYVVNHVSVYLNGVKQVIPTDVAASNGSTLVFAANLADDDAGTTDSTHKVDEVTDENDVVTSRTQNELVEDTNGPIFRLGFVSVAEAEALI